MATKMRGEPPKFDYDFVVLYHPYTHKSPKEILVKEAELGECVTKLMDDRTIQYVTVTRDRTVKRGKSKLWVGG